MIKMITAFIVIFLLFYFTILSVRMLSGKETWALVKMLTYSLVCAILTLTFLTGIVILF